MSGSVFADPNSDKLQQMLDAMGLKKPKSSQYGDLWARLDRGQLVFGSPLQVPGNEWKKAPPDINGKDWQTASGIDRATLGRSQGIWGSLFRGSLLQRLVSEDLPGVYTLLNIGEGVQGVDISVTASTPMPKYVIPFNASSVQCPVNIAVVRKDNGDSIPVKVTLECPLGNRTFDITLGPGGKWGKLVLLTAYIREFTRSKSRPGRWEHKT